MARDEIVTTIGQAAPPAANAGSPPGRRRPTGRRRVRRLLPLPRQIASRAAGAPAVTAPGELVHELAERRAGQLAGEPGGELADDTRPVDGRGDAPRAGGLTDTPPADGPADGPPVAPDRTAAAFFDVDNTVIRGASIYHLARGLYQRDFFTLADLLHFAGQQLRFVLLGENLEHVAHVQDRALAFVAGHEESELRAIGEEVYDELMAEKVWPGTVSLARRHLAAGQRVWLVTATPVEVADVIADRLGLSGALGTVAEHVDGVYTGRLVGRPMHGAAKADAVRALAEREGLDLARCSAYSDSANDIPMLSLVGTPVAINPDAKLRAHAREHGWQVYDYRTARKAALIGVPVMAGTGVALGLTVTVILASRKRRR